MSEALNTLGEVLRSQGDYARAAVVYDEAIVLRRTQNRQLALAMSLHNQGHVMLYQRDYQRAADFFTESLHLNSASDYKRGVAECLAGVAGVYAALEQRAPAIHLFAAATSLLEAVGARLDGVDQRDYDRNLAHAQAQMNEPAFAAAWAEGQAMVLEQALRLAFALEPAADGARHEQRPAARCATSLTVREVEVLRLVTHGLTNAQIAEQLVVSPRTVNAHLNAIYRKLDVRGRAAATRFAVEHNLT